MLRTQNPGLARRFPREYAFKFEDYTDDEMLAIFLDSCRKQNVMLESYEVAETAIKVLSKKRSLPNFGNVGTLKQLIQSAIAKALTRNQSDINSILITPNDIETGITKDRDPFEPLKKLTNVENIREGIMEIYNDFKVARAEGSEIPDVGHFVFRGSPGTGKTTVARVMADILFELEIVATKNIVETSGILTLIKGLDLTGQYLGQTKSKVNEMLGQAKGSVLFIDEAYELGKGPYGEEAMTTLLAAMTDPEYKGMVIIIAGYSKDIDNMLNRNEGIVISDIRIEISFYQIF